MEPLPNDEVGGDPEADELEPPERRWLGRAGVRKAWAADVDEGGVGEASEIMVVRLEGLSESGDNLPDENEEVDSVVELPAKEGIRCLGAEDGWCMEDGADMEAGVRSDGPARDGERGRVFECCWCCDWDCDEGRI